MSQAGGRGLAGIQYSIDASIQGFKDYINKRRGRSITIRNNTDYTSGNWTEIPRKKIRRKTTVWIFQVTNRRIFQRENLDKAKKEKL